MSATTASAKKSASPKKRATKPKVPASHLPYRTMVKQAIVALKDRSGSSRDAILKYILANFKLSQDPKVINNHVKMTLRAGLKNSSLKHAKTTSVGASGRFRIGEKAEKKAKSPKKPAAKRSPVKKASKPTKAASPKKPKAKKTTTKSPTKKAATKKPATKQTVKKVTNSAKKATATAIHAQNS